LVIVASPTSQRLVELMN